jgi:hypothetical protein
MKTWNTLAFVVMLLGGTVVVLSLMAGSVSGVMLIAGVVFGIWAICTLMAWRNDVGEREAQRHSELTRLLYSIYKAKSREN